MATAPANFSDGQMLEAHTASSHDKLKSRHLYMIAMGGKRDILSFAIEHPSMKID